MGLKEGNKDLVKKCNNFISLYQTEWPIYATRSRLQFDEKRKKEPQSLPLKRDIQKLCQHCIREIKRLTKKPQLAEDWYLLAETTLSRITTFNICSGGDPVILTMQDWEDAETGKWKKQRILESSYQRRKTYRRPLDRPKKSSDI